MYASVTDVKKGESGAPGELHGSFDVNRDLGDLYANTNLGIYGVLRDGALSPRGEAVEVAAREEVHVGGATILSNIAGEQVEEYQVEITHVYPAAAGDTRNLMVQVTDPRLLETTGGIVQGMVVSYNRDNSGEKPLRRKALRACRIGAPVRCRRGQYGTTPFLQTG